MKFNPSKCVHLAITRKKLHIIFCYQIHSQHTQQTKSAKYLGVVIEEWKEHVNNICSKATKAKAFLQRNFYSLTKIHLSCYTSMVRPMLENAATVWSPHL